MNDSQKIEEGAIKGAREDFESLNEWLEELKKKIQDFEIKNPANIYGGLAFLSLGYFFGLRNDSKIKWLLEGLSGALFGYSLVNFLAEVNRTKEREKEEKPEALSHVHIIQADEKQD